MCGSVGTQQHKEHKHGVFHALIYGAEEVLDSSSEHVTLMGVNDIININLHSGKK